MDLSSRPYAAADLPRVEALLVAHLAAGHEFDIAVADLRQVLARSSTGSERHGQVWQDAGGALVGFGLVWPPSNTVLTLVHPDVEERATQPPLRETIVRWVVQNGQAIAHEQGKDVQVRFRPYDDDQALIALIERYGFGPENWFTVKYTRAIVDAIPEPRPPSGFILRHVAGEHEVANYVALHRDAFGTAILQVEERLAFMRDPEYVPELDLVAEAPDGTLAAFVVGGIDREESRLRGQLIGSTDPLGTRPAFRRRGLARALLCEAFNRLRQRDVRVATVGTGSWNTATMRLVESTGFRLTSKVLAYAREFR